MAASGSFNTSGYGNRYLTFSWSIKSQSIANNSTTISWTLKGAGGGTSNWYQAGNFKVTIDGKQVYYSSARIQLYNGTTVASGTYTFYHDSAGNRSFKAYAEAGIYTVAVNCSGSGSWSLTQIARYSKMSTAPNWSDEQNPTITFTNPSGGVFPLKAKIEAGGNTQLITRTIPANSTSYTFTLTDAERDTLRNLSKSSKTLATRFTICCMSGTTELSVSYLDRTMTVINATPTFTVAYLDANATTTAITGNNQQIVQNQSQLRIAVTGAVAKKNATLTTASCTILNTPYSVSVASGSGNLNIGAVNSTQSLDVAVTVADSRGYTTTKTIKVNVLEWKLPTALITVQRHNNFYSQTDIKADAEYSSVDSKNSIAITYRYKKTTETSYSDWGTLVDNTVTTVELDNNYAWDIQVAITDKFGTTTYNVPLSRGMPIIYFDRAKSSTGFNCFPTDEQSVEINGANILGKVLWEDANGTASSVTLSDSIYNYKTLEIYYTDNTKLMYDSIKVPMPTSGLRAFTIGCVFASGTSSQTYLKRTRWQVQDKSLSQVTGTNGYVEITGSNVTSGTGNYILVTKVIGYKF